MKISINQKLFLFAFIILTINGILGYAVYKSNQKVLDSEEWVRHTEQVIYQSGNVRSVGNDIEATSKCFVITNDSVYLEPLNAASKTAMVSIRQLRQLIRDNPGQLQRIDSLNFYMHKLLDFSVKIVKLRSTASQALAIPYASANEGKKYTDRVSQIINSVQLAENILLKQRKQTSERSEAEFKQFSVIIFILITGFTILLVIIIGKYLFQSKEKEERAAELDVANDELSFQNQEKEKRAAELVIANKELLFQHTEKGKRADELTIANKELLFQNEEKEKRAAELDIANDELSFQNEEKGKRAAELVVANDELSFQSQEKEKRAEELVIANKELSFQNNEKEKRAAELVIANKELSFQSEEKEKRAAELVIANMKLLFQNQEKEKRATELAIANYELSFQNQEKEKRAAELVIANKELLFQNEEKERRAAELVIANEELSFQNAEKEKRAVEKEFDQNNLNALINNTSDLMWSVDIEFNLITSNQPFNEFVKLLSGKELKNGESVLTTKFPAEQLIQYKRFYKRAFNGENFSEILYNAYPVEIWSEISYCPIRKGKQVIGSACHSRNITEKLKSERQLRYSEEFNRGVLNSLSNHIAVLDNSGTIVAVNEAWKRFASENGDMDMQFTGVGNNYFNVCDKSSIYGEKNAAEALQGMKDVMTGTEDIFYMEYPCHSVDEQRWFGMIAMRFESDHPMIVVSHQNISERKLAEKKLLHSESLLKEAQEIAHIGNYEIDLVNDHVVWSDEMYEMLGVEKSISPSSKLFTSFIHPDDRDDNAALFEAQTDGAMDYRIVRKDGVTRYIYNNWKYEYGKNKKPVRLYGILQDITERKQADIERTKMVSEMVIRNKDLEQFAYIISHNLRAPVANIIGASNALGDPDLTSEDKDILSRGINVSINKLDNVVKDLNQILQVKGTINEVKETVKFSELVKDIKISINNLIDQDDITINDDFSSVNELSTLKPYLYSIFYNLISNSVKYRRQDIPCVIDIRSRLLKNRLELVFKDNGMGIDLSKNSENVFGLYKRFHTNIEGKGMGLFMVKTQVETLGGKISLKSETNKGSEFLIEFEK